jgi:hypothetical protein
VAWLALGLEDFFAEAAALVAGAIATVSVVGRVLFVNDVDEAREANGWSWKLIERVIEAGWDEMEEDSKRGDWGIKNQKKQRMREVDRVSGARAGKAVVFISGGGRKEHKCNQYRDGPSLKVSHTNNTHTLLHWHTPHLL